MEPPSNHATNRDNDEPSAPRNAYGLAPTRATWLDLLAVPSIWSLVLGLQSALAAVAIGWWVLSTGGDLAEGMDKLPELTTQPAFILLAVLGDALITTGVVAFVTMRLRQQSAADAFRVAWTGWRSVGIAAGVGVLAATLATALMTQFSSGTSMMAELSSTWQGLLVISFAALLMPLVEELYYRGFIYTILDKELSRLHPRAWILAALIVTAWFGAVHAFQVAGDWVALPVITLMGLVWTLMRRHYDSLLPSMLSHWSYNATLIALSWLAVLLGEST